MPCKLHEICVAEKLAQPHLLGGRELIELGDTRDDLFGRGVEPFPGTVTGSSLWTHGRPAGSSMLCTPAQRT